MCFMGSGQLPAQPIGKQMLHQSKQENLYQSKPDQGAAIKFDSQKRRMELLSVPAMNGTADVLTFGAQKYADRNWEKGFEFSRVYGAMLRHMTAWWDGEDIDPESGLHHLDHAACCIMFLQHFVKTRTGTDNRPVRQPTNPTTFTKCYVKDSTGNLHGDSHDPQSDQR